MNFSLKIDECFIENDEFTTNEQGDATVMLGVAFTTANIKFEIVHLDLSQHSIEIATARVKVVIYIQIDDCLH